MRRVLLIYFFALIGTVACGQYVPNNGQAFQFVSVTNPAFSGVENFADLKLGYRHQWSGFGSHSPQYMNLSFNTRLKHPVDLIHNSMRMSNPKLAQAQNLPKGKQVIHGLGVNVFHSEVGIINSIGGSVNYAWNYPLSKKFRLSMGVSSLVESRVLRLEDLTFNDPRPDPFYNHLLSSASSQVDVSLRTGALLYSKGFYLGVSYLSLLNKPIAASDATLEEPFYRASLQTGFSVHLNPAVAFKPSILAYFLVDDSFSIDYNLKAYLQNKGWVGLTYRDSQTGILMIGLNVTESLNACYSYEVGFGGFQPFGGSSHELVIGFRINNLKNAATWLW